MLQTLGNHDFDYGIPDLLHFLEGTECAVVVSNINSSHEPSWPHSKQLVKKSQVFDLGGQKVGIVGYVITSTGRYDKMCFINFDFQFILFLHKLSFEFVQMELKATVGAGKSTVMPRKPTSSRSLNINSQGVFTVYNYDLLHLPLCIRTLKKILILESTQ